MTIQLINKNNINIVHVKSDDKVIIDAQSALDLAMTISYEYNTSYIIIDKQCIIEDFFILSTGIAGEILQKFINYGIKFAVVGDFSHYTSKPLNDFIFESNKGKSAFFVKSIDEAIEKLSSN